MNTQKICLEYYNLFRKGVEAESYGDIDEDSVVILCTINERDMLRAVIISRLIREDSQRKIARDLGIKRGVVRRVGEKFALCSY